ncbi:thiamine diphosphokinase [Halpernia sp.]|uniref:thiamine diphosphokinase n=1 Tax=Halpernia sp. TaxID=2782209 RepID=UPI003A8EEC2F
MKALLFINGIPPKKLPKTENYSVISCTDGAFHYLKKMNFPLEKLDIISGDFDSHCEEEILQQTQNNEIEVIFTPDQNNTDFHKALEILVKKNITDVDVFGGSGGEMDHFLGNLSVAFSFKNHLKITFYDDDSQYFFADKNLLLNQVKGKMISLYPFPLAEKITTKGLQWELNNEDLNILKRIGTRNRALENEVEINFESGNLIIFIHY